MHITHTVVLTVEYVHTGPSSTQILKSLPTDHLTPCRSFESGPTFVPLIVAITGRIVLYSKMYGVFIHPIAFLVLISVTVTTSFHTCETYFTNPSNDPFTPTLHQLLEETSLARQLELVVVSPIA